MRCSRSACFRASFSRIWASNSSLYARLASSCRAQRAAGCQHENERWRPKLARLARPRAVPHAPRLRATEHTPSVAPAGCVPPAPRAPAPWAARRQSAHPVQTVDAQPRQRRRCHAALRPAGDAGSRCIPPGRGAVSQTRAIRVVRAPGQSRRACCAQATHLALSREALLV